VLMLSGIGDEAELDRHGIDVVAHLPGVGQNLHDHLLSPLIYSAEREIGQPAPGVPHCQTHLWWRSKPGLVAPDVQPIHFSVPLYEKWMKGPPNAFSLMAGMIRPASRGSIKLTSADPAAELAIDPAALACESDLETLVSSVELCREYAASPALREWGTAEIYPGPAVSSRAELRDYVRKTAITYHHQVGTCKMGVDELAVVDSGAARPRRRGPARRGRIGDADGAVRQHQRALDHDRRTRIGLRGRQPRAERRRVPRSTRLTRDRCAYWAAAMAQNIRLEPLAERHVADVAALLEDPDVVRFTRVPEPVPPGFAEIWLGTYEAARADGSREAFAALGPDGHFVGLALAPDIDREGRELELGYIVARDARGRGAGTEILRLLTEWAFKEAGALRIYLIIDVTNTASERLAQRCGYVREGVMRSQHLKQGIRVDAGLWSRLPTDPEPD